MQDNSQDNQNFGTGAGSGPYSKWGLYDEFAGQLRKRAMTILIIRGVLALLLGIFLVAAPVIAGASLATVISIFIAIWLIADGIGTSMLAWQERKIPGSKWGWPFAGGIAAILAGIGIFVFPLSFAWAGSLLVLWFVVVSVIISGIALIQNREFISGGLAMGIISLIFGVLLAVLLVTNPSETMVSFVWVMGVFTIAHGISAIIMGFKVRPKKAN